MGRWLSHEPRTLWIVLTILVMPLLYDIWCTGVMGLYTLGGYIETVAANNPNANLTVTWQLWLIMIPWVLGEEIVFRFPLSFAARFLRCWPRVRDGMLIFLVLTLSALFGWVHGGILFVPIQGVLGLIFSLCYLKFGGYNGKFWKPLLLCWMMHVAVNSHLFALQLAANHFGIGY